jgi:ribosomal protein L7/L12
MKIVDQRFTVVLAAIGKKKIEVIKEVRELTGLGLKATVDLGEKAHGHPGGSGQSGGQKDQAQARKGRR